MSNMYLGHTFQFIWSYICQIYIIWYTPDIRFRHDTLSLMIERSPPEILQKLGQNLHYIWPSMPWAANDSHLSVTYISNDQTQWIYKMTHFGPERSQTVNQDSIDTLILAQNLQIETQFLCSDECARLKHRFCSIDSESAWSASPSVLVLQRQLCASPEVELPFSWLIGRIFHPAAD